jgi:hypothetical protein
MLLGFTALMVTVAAILTSFAFFSLKKAGGLESALPEPRASKESLGRH